MSEDKKQDERPVMRDASGKFLPGTAQINPGPKRGAGGPPATRKELVARLMTGEVWDSIIASVIEKARQGSFKHIEWLADQGYGKQAVTIDGNLGLRPVLALSPAEIDAQLEAYKAEDAEKEAQKAISMSMEEIVVEDADSAAEGPENGLQSVESN